VKPRAAPTISLAGWVIIALIDLALIAVIVALVLATARLTRGNGGHRPPVRHGPTVTLTRWTG